MPLVLPGDPVGIMWFAGALEVGKIVTASALAVKWRRTPVWLRTGLLAAVVALAAINAWGVHSTFNRNETAPHTEQTADIKQQQAAIEAQLAEVQHLNADLVRDRDQIDETVKSMMDHKHVNAALALLHILQLLAASTSLRPFKLESVITAAAHVLVSVTVTCRETDTAVNVECRAAFSGWHQVDTAAITLDHTMKSLLVVFTLIALAVWFLGRACRYVLVGMAKRLSGDAR